MSGTTERRGLLLLLALGLSLLLLPRWRTWTTVPEELTTLGRDVDLPGAVLFEIGLGYALLVATGLGVLLVARRGWRRTAAVAVAVLSVLAFSQALDAGSDPGKAVVESDDGLRRLGLDAVADRASVEALGAADLPVTAWWPVTLLGTLLCGAASSAVAVRCRRWDDEPVGEQVRGWWAS